MKLGKAIKTCRIQREMSQAQLANLAEISVSYLSLLEKDKRDPSFSTIQKVAEGLKIPISLLTFLAAEKDEIVEISPELAAKLSLLALQLIGRPSDAELSI